jgi:hypothetical protein
MKGSYTRRRPSAPLFLIDDSSEKGQHAVYQQLQAAGDRGNADYEFCGSLCLGWIRLIFGRYGAMWGNIQNRLKLLLKNLKGKSRGQGQRQQ